MKKELSDNETLIIKLIKLNSDMQLLLDIETELQKIRKKNKEPINSKLQPLIKMLYVFVKEKRQFSGLTYCEKSFYILSIQFKLQEAF